MNKKDKIITGSIVTMILVIAILLPIAYDKEKQNDIKYRSKPTTFVIKSKAMEGYWSPFGLFGSGTAYMFFDENYTYYEVNWVDFNHYNINDVYHYIP